MTSTAKMLDGRMTVAATVAAVLGNGVDSTSGYRVRLAEMSDVAFLADVVIEATTAQGGLPEDLDVAEFRREYIGWTEEHVRGEIPFSSTSVIEVEGTAVGRLRVVRDGTRIELAGIQLRPEVQSRGIGSRVIEDLKSEAARSGLPLELSVEHDNPRARALYERLGFVQIGTDDDEATLRWAVPRAD